MPEHQMAMENGGVGVNDNKFPAGNTLELKSRVDTGDAQKLISWYTGQLVEGCGNVECREILCRTGRLNTAKAPIRTYNPRSARAIAFTLCTGPDPRRHLCRFFHSNHKSQSRAGLDAGSGRPQDESSLVQRLCDTAALSGLDGPRGSSSVTAFPDFKELQKLHDQLSTVTDESIHKPGKEFRPNSDLVEILAPPLGWLLARGPLGCEKSWEWVEREVISRGQGYPPRGGSEHSYSPESRWLDILDTLNHEPYLRLLSRICQIVARRTLLERVVAHAVSRSYEVHRSLNAMLVSRLCIDNNANPGKIHALLTWLKRLFAKHWNAQPIVKSGSACHGALSMMSGLYWYSSQHACLQSGAFYMPMVSACVTTVDLAESWLIPISADEDHVLLWHFMLSDKQLYLFFRTVNHLHMRRAHSEVHQARLMHDRAPSWVDTRDSEQVQHDTRYYFLLSVSRGNILRDTFDQLWQRRKSEFRRPLRVRLGEVDELEIGHDLGGVQIEFFNLVCRELFSGQSQPATGCSYFKPGSLQPLYMFEMVGLLTALAMYNGITLPINLPWIFYYYFTQNGKGPATVPGTIQPEKLADCWPTVSRSLRSILDEDVDDLELEYSFPMEANGLRLTVSLPRGTLNRKLLLPVIDATIVAHHDDPATAVENRVPEAEPDPFDAMAVAHEWPGWHLTRPSKPPKTVTSANKAQYVHDYIQWLTYSSVYPQIKAFWRGFDSSALFEPFTVALFGPEKLKAYVEGSDNLNIDELRAATRYDGYDGKSKYIQSFWRIVTSWSQEKQKQLLKFVTAAERIPITGASQLTFVIKRSAPESMDYLPTSSTCFGTLMLPRYGSADILAEKLSKAVEYGAVGFGNG